jgi:phospholipid/cholesterol/gamma-HCH transport system substrate-binding protein
VGNSRVIGRIVAVAAVVVVVIVVVAVLIGSRTAYTVKADFTNASQLVKGNQVEVGGASVGTVRDITLTPNGQAQVTMAITGGGFTTLRQGTVATIREASLSGVANRYVDLEMPPGNPPAIKNNGLIPTTDTNTAVDLDQVFNMFDQPTRKSLSGVIRGFSTLYGGQGMNLQNAYTYFNPEVASSSELFNEINYDTPLLERFIVASSNVVTDLATREPQLSGLIKNLSSATGAIASQRGALADALVKVPPFFTQADTTFKNLNTTLDTLTPLVNDSKPVAARLGPLLDQLRPFAHDAVPTLRDLAVLIKNPVPNSDLISLMKSAPAVRDIALGPVTANGATHQGAFPESTTALNGAAPELAFARPYATDLEGWFNDFGTSGDQDALGGASRSSPIINAFSNANGLLSPIPASLRAQAFNSVASVNQRDRCPGAAEHGTVYKPAPDFNCNLADTLPGS